MYKKILLTSAFAITTNVQAALHTNNNDIAADNPHDNVPDKVSNTFIANIKIPVCLNKDYGLQYDIKIGVLSATQAQYEYRAGNLMENGPLLQDIMIKTANSEAASAYKQSPNINTDQLAESFAKTSMNKIRKQISPHHAVAVKVKLAPESCYPINTRP